MSAALRDWILSACTNERLSSVWREHDALPHQDPLTWARGPGAALCRQVEALTGEPATYTDRHGQVRGNGACAAAYSAWLEDSAPHLRLLPGGKP